MKRILLCAVLSPVLLFVVEAVAAAILLPPMPMPEGGFAMLAFSILITAWALSVLALNVTARGWHRVALLFLVAAGIPANNLIEAVFFPLDIPSAHLLPLFLNALLSGALFAVVLHLLAGPAAAPRPAPSVPQTAGSPFPRLAAAVATYIALYFIAGQLVWPFVSHFYASRALPQVGAILAMQVFRGAVFTAIVYAIVRLLALRPLPGSLLVAAILALVGGVAPLMIPNPYMPASIRFPHMAEVGVSNFLFGLIAARLLRR